MGVLLTVLAALATHALIRSNPPSAEERDAKAREARLHSDWPWLALYAGDNAAMESSHRPVEVVFLGDSITEFWRYSDPAFFFFDRAGSTAALRARPRRRSFSAFART